MHKYIIVILAILTACSPESDDTYSVDDDVSAGSERIAADTSEASSSSISELHLIAEEYYDRFGNEYSYLIEDENGQPAIDVYNCLVFYEDGSPEERLARYSVSLSRELAAAGFASSSYTGAIDRFEKQALMLGDDIEPREILLSNMAAEIDSSRSQAAAPLPRVISEGGCGAGEVPVLFTTSVPAGRIWVMGAFDFMACSKKNAGADPYDGKTCRWVETSPSRPVPLSGRYAYQIRVKGARKQEGFDKIDPALAFDEDEPIRVKLP